MNNLEYYKRKLQESGITKDKQKEILTTFVMAVNRMGVFFDQIGLCCPTCTSTGNETENVPLHVIHQPRNVPQFEPESSRSERVFPGPAQAI